MELTGELLKDDSLCKVGINIGPDNELVWIFPQNSVVNTDGSQLDTDISPVLWLERPMNTTVLINGEAFRDLC